MKRIAIFPFVLLSGLASAQTVDWNRVRSSCSSEIGAYEAVRGTGDSSHQAMRFLESEVGAPASSGKLRVLIEKQREQLSDAYLMKTPVFRFSAEMYLCAATAALNQLQSRSTQTTQRTPTPVLQQESDNDHAQCVQGNESEKALVNRCSKAVNLVWCAAPKGGEIPGFNCEMQAFSYAYLSPGGRAAVQDGFEIHFTTCDEPKKVVNARYVRGRGIEGKCRR